MTADSSTPARPDAYGAERRDMSTELAMLLETWHDAAQSVVALLRSLEPDEWSRPTDLPGWDVRAVAAHLAHLESELAGNPQAHVEVPEAPHIKGLMGQFTEAGPLARASWSTEAIVDELESSVATRYAAISADPPSDLTEPGPGFAALIGWSWETLLRNRPLDLWMHEQDIRRATGRQGNLDSAAASLSVEVYLRSLPFVLGKRVRPEAGTTVAVHVTGPVRRSGAARQGDDGRAVALPEVPADPTAALRCDTETFAMAAGGRRPPEALPVELTGDEELARRVLQALAVTP